MKLLILISTFSLVLAFFDDDFGSFNRAPPVVKVSSGKLRGDWDETSNGRAFAKFEAIPYAKPPVGKLRFQAPQPIEPWGGIFNASGAQESCLQYDPFFETVSGSEDCLFINVYTPHVDSSASLPVMVYIHGGSFMYGAGAHYDPALIMDWDMVVVTFNYRLGPLGFLSTGDGVIPGNAGLKDQAFALHWVKKNIRVFGGNPDSITLTGCSAGASSVHYLYLSPLARGTFARGIAWSGSAFAPWAYSTKPVEKTKWLASLVDCPTEDTEEMANCLISRPGEDVVNATTRMFDWKLHVFSPFVPTAEPEGTEGAFLTVHPYEATSAGAMYPAPLIATVVTEEGLYPAAAYQKEPEEFFPEIEDNWAELARDIFYFNDTLPLERRADVAAKIKDHYLQGEAVSNDTFKPIVQAIGDRLFVSGVGKMAELHAAESKQPVYMYKYGFRGQKSSSFAFTWNYDDYGVAHGDDLFHIFFVPLITSSTKDDTKMTEALMNMVYSYAKGETPKFFKDAPEWLPVTPGESALNYMEIKSPTSFEMKVDPDFGQRSFWDSLGFNEDQNYRKL